ncbi:Two-component transcriptional response regulator, LuxR family [hydrothermal vent metagenome]|uniref:Two-component transcriptional response regulator, LuxR family n=1 Tax=hydrothermal vent metagenome TaxID=652676 RepID=A0A3B0T0S1_9ZZZZ
MNVAADTPLGHLLVVDDDRDIRVLLKQFLTRQGFRVTTAADGYEMQAALSDWKIDLVVLDLMLPGKDGLSICRDLRATSRMPIVMLTVMGEENDRIQGFGDGADDYIAKPFNPHELLARIRAVLHRTHMVPPAAAAGCGRIFLFDDWRLDVGLRCLKSAGGTLVDLSTAEFDLLAAFVEHPRQVLSRDQLLDLARGKVEIPFDRKIDMQVSRLRHKIEADPKHPTLIRTVRGAGYVFTAKVARDEASAA